MSELKVIDTKWFTQMMHPSTIGIVLVDTGFGHKAYIGTGFGIDEGSDQQTICRNGSRFRPAQALWPDITNWAD